MSKLLVVFGATGQQGGSVIHTVLNDPELSQQFALRGVTRDPASSKAQALKEQGVEVVQADVDDDASILPALKGAHTVFSMTAPSFNPAWKGSEWIQGKAIADAAVAQGAQYIIFSTLPHVKVVSGGKYTKVMGFDIKAEVEDYIHKLPIRSAFFAPGSFMQNWLSNMKPKKSADGVYYVERHVSPQTQLPLIDTPGDTGKFVAAILAEPDKYEGKVFCAATRLYSMVEIAQIISKVTGKDVRYRQASEEEALKILPPAPYGPMLVEMMCYQQDFGYYGPGTKDLVAWAVEHARGEPIEFEEFLKMNPLGLE
jgi:uncharacterized protein YbjT (DUF2867 family)